MSALAEHFRLLDPAAGKGEPSLHSPFIESRHPVWDDDWTDPYGGFRYICPTCGWKSRTMMYRCGAERLAEEHGRECAGSSSATASATADAPEKTAPGEASGV